WLVSPARCCRPCAPPSRPAAVRSSSDAEPSARPQRATAHSGLRACSSDGAPAAAPEVRRDRRGPDRRALQGHHRRRQRGARALGLLRESLSAHGCRTARDIMRLNGLVLAITGSQAEYGEWLYWLSVMGIPSFDGPWGWQIDGHHLIVNCFVLGDQVVMTPMFMGSEPVAAHEGPHAGTRVFQAEERQGLALMRALTPEQRQ